MKKYLHLNQQELAGLPKAGRASYWVYHVWDVKRIIEGQGVADEALKKFKGKNQEVEDAIIGSVFPGPPEDYYDSGC
jgi:hypothetical protein